MPRIRFAAGLVLGVTVAIVLPALAAVSTKSLLPAFKNLPTVALPTVGSEGYLSVRVPADGAPSLVRILGGLGDSAKTAVANATATGTLATDMSAGTYRQLTETGNVTLSAPTNAQLGQTLCYQITQDATGGRTTTFNAAFKMVAWSETGNTTGKVSSTCFIVSSTTGPVLQQIAPQVAYH
jgi:hypothetical protein